MADWGGAGCWGRVINQNYARVSVRDVLHYFTWPYDMKKAFVSSISRQTLAIYTLKWHATEAWAIESQTVRASGADERYELHRMVIDLERLPQLGVLRQWLALCVRAVEWPFQGRSAS